MPSRLPSSNASCSSASMTCATWPGRCSPRPERPPRRRCGASGSPRQQPPCGTSTPQMSETVTSPPIWSGGGTPTWPPKPGGQILPARWRPKRPRNGEGPGHPEPGLTWALVVGGGSVQEYAWPGPGGLPRNDLHRLEPSCSTGQADPCPPGRVAHQGPAVAA